MTFKKYLLLIMLLIISLANIYSQQQPAEQQEEAVSEEDLVIIDEDSANTPQPDITERELGTFTFFDFLRMILILLFVILCIYALFYFLKKAGYQKYDENELINIVASKSISPNKVLHIVEIGNQLLVISSTDSSINFLTELTDKETVDTVRLYKGETRKPPENSFYNYLLGNLFRGKTPERNKGKIGENSDFSSEYLKKQRERIEKM